MTHADNLSTIVTLADRMLAQKGLGPVVAVEPIAGGRNNRAFRVEGSTGQWLLKQYFRSPQGGRDRCGSEWDWLSFCWRQNVRWGPEPILCERGENASLLEFIEGCHLYCDEIGVTHVEQAAAFVSEVNRARNVAAAHSLSNAAEACFSIRQHLDCVERRILRLRSLPVSDSLDKDLQGWLAGSLFPTWESISRSLTTKVDSDKLSSELATKDRCLSPSDFGFHNALLTPSGRLRFLDFEYAGWDDPAKLVCDFFWQQDRPAPRDAMSKLVSVLADEDTRAELESRIATLTPLYGLKWCCLILNEFVAEDRRRREFAQSVPVTDDRRAEQLARARQLLIEARNSI